MGAFLGKKLAHNMRGAFLGGHGGTAYYIYSQRHYLSYAPAL